MSKELKLWYTKPAPGITKITPERTPRMTSGKNGRYPLEMANIGANVFGGTETERIQITENSLSNPKSVGGLNNFAEIFLDFAHSDVEDYRRDLVLDTAISHVEYTHKGVRYEREYFTSYPDQVMVIRIAASEKGAVQFTLRPTIPYIKSYGREEGDGGGKSGTVTGEGRTLTLSGVLHYYNIAFEGQLRVITENGTVTMTADASGDHAELHVDGADSARDSDWSWNKLSHGEPRIYGARPQKEAGPLSPSPRADLRYHGQSLRQVLRRAEDSAFAGIPAVF